MGVETCDDALPLPRPCPISQQESPAGTWLIIRMKKLHNMEALCYRNAPKLSGRVFSYSEPDLRTEDGAPLYLEWVLEEENLALYIVPAEPGGWFGRARYRGSRTALRPVPPEKARLIISLLCGCVERESRKEARQAEEDACSVQPPLPGEPVWHT